MSDTHASHRTVHRQCQLCEAHCGVVVHIEDERVTRIEGDPGDVLSNGYICPKGTALADLHHDGDRLRQPLKRVGDGFEEISWDEAYALAGRRLRDLRRRHGRDAVGVYQGNPTAHSSAALATEVLKKVLRSRNTFSASSIDQFPQHVAAMELFGDPTLMPVADVDRTDHLLVIGANPAVSNGSITTMPDARGRLRAIRKRGGTVTVVDPRRTETARLADAHLAVRPGGDPYLLAAVIHVVLAEDLATPPAWAHGIDRLWQLVAPWDPDRAAGPAGVAAEDIRQLARAFATAPSAVAYGRIGVCHHQTGSVTHWLITVLNAVTGNLDSPGGAMFTTPPVDLARVLRLMWGEPDRDRWRSRVSDLPEMLGELPVVALPEEITTPGDRQLRGLITLAGNPALSTPDADRVDAALRDLDLLISVDMYVTETSRHADLILPPTSQLERGELDLVFPYFSVRNNARWSPAAFEPPADAQHDWDIVLRLAAELLDAPVRPAAPLARGVRRVVRAVTERLPAERIVAALILTGPQGPLRRGPRGLTAAKVRRSRGGIDLGPLEPRMPGRLRTPDSRVDLAPTRLAEAFRALTPSPVGPRDGYDLQLIGRRHLRSNNSWMHNVPAMVKGRDRCTALVHPDEADARGLVDGQQVVVTSPIGQIELPLEVSDELRPGVVVIPHGWGHDVKGVGWSTAAAHGGANVNRLTDPALVDGLSGNAAVNATWVRIAAAPVSDGLLQQV